MKIFFNNYPLVVAIIVSFFLSITLFADDSCIGGRARSELSAVKLLECVEKKYLLFKTYSDSGTVKTTIFSEDNWLRKKTLIKLFSTIYIKDKVFRHEFKSKRGDDEWDKYIIWAKEGNVLVWWDVDSVISSNNSLEEAISSAIGVSSGSSYIIPALLFTGTFPAKWRLSRLNKLSAMNDVSIQGIQYAVIKGVNSRGNTIIIYINKSSWFIEKVIRKIKFISSYDSNIVSAEIVITYIPKANVDINPSKTEFGAPLFPALTPAR